jgi:hypothetical protein
MQLSINLWFQHQINKNHLVAQTCMQQMFQSSTSAVTLGFNTTSPTLITQMRPLRPKLRESLHMSPARISSFQRASKVNDTIQQSTNED